MTWSREQGKDGSVIAFVKKLLRTELSDEVDLQIQRTHKALAPIPGFL